MAHNRHQFLSTNFLRGALALVLCAWSARSHAAIELSATAEEYVGEGITYRRLIFSDDKRRLELELPAGWRHRNDGSARLILIPPGNGFAEASIEVHPLPPSATLDEAAQRALEQDALTSVRPDSQAVELVEAKHDSVALQAHATAEAVVSYKALGYTFRRSIVLVNLRESRLILRFTAPEAEFAKMNSIFRRAVSTCDWQ